MIGRGAGEGAIPLLVAITLCGCAQAAPSDAGSESDADPAAQCYRVLEQSCSTAARCLDELPALARRALPPPVTLAIEQCPGLLESQGDQLRGACDRMVEGSMTLASGLASLPTEEIETCAASLECSVESVRALAEELSALEADPPSAESLVTLLVGDCLPDPAAMDAGPASDASDASMALLPDAASIEPDAGAGDPGCGSGCGGCCLDGRCLPGDDLNACGLGGVRCVVCSDAPCLGGRCSVPSSSRWDVRIGRVVVEPRNTSGTPWDSSGSAQAPDVYVRLEVQDGARISERSSERPDTTVALFHETVLDDIRASALLGGIDVSVYDQDGIFNEDDYIGGGLLVPTGEMFLGEWQTVTWPRDVAMGQSGVELEIQIVPGGS